MTLTRLGRPLASAKERLTVDIEARSAAHLVVGRFALLGVASYLFFTALSLYPATGANTFAIFAVLSLYLGALACFVLAATALNPLDQRVQLASLVLVLTAITLHFWYQSEFNLPFYGTDGIAFNHAAAEMVMDGENPYEVAGLSLKPVTDRFDVPESYITQTTDGEGIDRLMSYPAGSFLLYIPFLAAGLDDLRWVTLLFELAAIGSLWVVLMPRGLSVLGLVPLLIDPNLTVYFTAGGVTDWIWALPTLLSAVMLFYQRNSSAAVLMGLACAIKQEPWLALPFVVIWIALQPVDWRHGSQEAVRFIAVVAGVFLAVNLVFILMAPSDWAHGVLEPMLDNTVPDGQGLSLLSSRGLFSLPKEFYSAALVAVYFASIYLFCAHFNRMQYLLWLFPAIVIFVSYRSFQNYFIYWIPIGVVWLGLHEPWKRAGQARGGTPLDAWPALLKVPGAAILVVGVLAGSVLVGVSAGGEDRVTLAIEVVGAEAPGGFLESVDVSVRNQSHIEVDLAFYLQFGGYPFRWRSEGPSTIGADSVSTFRLRPQTSEAIPAVTVASDGSRRPAPFRVRVNAVGDSVFFASGATQPAPEPGPANGSFRFWLPPKPGTEISGPAAWTVALLGQESTGVKRLTPDHGVVLEVAPNTEASGAAEWFEAAILQEVGALSACYDLSLLPDTDYVSTDSGSPLSGGGLQIIQNGRTLWFVGSSLGGTFVDLGDGTRVSPQRVVVGEWNAIRLNVSEHAQDLDFETGRPALVKIFNAVHQSQAGSRNLSVAEIRGTTC